MAAIKLRVPRDWVFPYRGSRSTFNRFIVSDSHAEDFVALCSLVEVNHKVFYSEMFDGYIIHKMMVVGEL